MPQLFLYWGVVLTTQFGQKSVCTILADPRQPDTVTPRGRWVIWSPGGTLRGAQGALSHSCLWCLYLFYLGLSAEATSNCFIWVHRSAKVLFIYCTVNGRTRNVSCCFANEATGTSLYPSPDALLPQFLLGIFPEMKFLDCTLTFNVTITVSYNCCNSALRFLLPKFSPYWVYQLYSYWEQMKIQSPLTSSFF